MTNSIKKNISILLVLSSVGMAVSSVSAAGVSLGATRLIFPTNKEKISVKSYNTDSQNSYLIQSWVSDENGNKVEDFLVTPPLFIQKNNSDNVLGIVFSGNKNDLPKDREKVYYFNSKVIPSLSKSEQEIPNALLIATTTNIKLFMRPPQLADGSLEAYKKLSCNYKLNSVVVENNSPYYMNLMNMNSNGSLISNGIMVPPFDSKEIQTKTQVKSMTYEFINDYGVRSELLNCPAI